MKLFFTLLGGMCSLAMIGAGCSAPSTLPSSSEVITPSFDWSQVTTASVTASNGLVIKSCGGAAPLVCVFKEGKPVGQMELLEYDTTGEGQTVDERIQDFYKNIGEDRKEVCPTGFSVVTTTPASARVAGGAGTRARLEVRDAMKKLVERYTLFLLERGTKLYVFNISGYEKGSCVSEEVEYTTIQNLDKGAQEALEAVVKTSILPQ